MPGKKPGVRTCPTIAIWVWRLLLYFSLIVQDYTGNSDKVLNSIAKLVLNHFYIKKILSPLIYFKFDDKIIKCEFKSFI